MSAASLPLFAEPARALDAIQQQGGGEEVLEVPKSLRAANTRAATIAASSPFVRAQMAQVRVLARSISNAALRADVMTLLDDPAPRYVRRYATDEARRALRDDLARAGLVAADAPIDGLFPPLNAAGFAQPFWSAPGSETNGHHAYPGGLCLHELFNARMGRAFAQTYDREYFSSRNAVDQDIAVAAALYHDIMKTVVFQYRDDGTLFDELSIGATGAHHCLSGAEAIVRGHDARFVTVLLSAHAAPSLGDEAKVVTWCRAAAMIAGVDPIAFGLLRRDGDGFVLAQPPPIEAFVNHLSDHDYVLAIHAAHEVRPRLAALAPRFGIAAAEIDWWRLEVGARVSDIALYHELTRGEDAFEKAVTRAVA